MEFLILVALGASALFGVATLVRAVWLAVRPHTGAPSAKRRVKTAESGRDLADAFFAGIPSRAESRSERPQPESTTEMSTAVPGTDSESEAVTGAEGSDARVGLPARSSALPGYSLGVEDGNDTRVRLLLDSWGYVTPDMLTEVEAGQRSEMLAEYATRNRLTDPAILIGEQLVRPVLGGLQPSPSTEVATDRSQSSEPGATEAE